MKKTNALVTALLAVLLGTSAAGNIYQYLELKNIKQGKENLEVQVLKMQKGADELKQTNNAITSENASLKSKLSSYEAGSKQNEQEQAQKETSETTAKIGDIIKLDNTTVVIKSVKTNNSFAGFTAKPGDMYFVISYEILTSLKPGETTNNPYFHPDDFIAVETSGGYRAGFNFFSSIDDRISQNKKSSVTSGGTMVKGDKIIKLIISEPHSDKKVAINLQ